MSESVKDNLQSVPDSTSRIGLRAVLDTIQADLTALRAAIVGITAQLDADATVTDTDYAANNDPAALTTLP